ncbi:MAG: hypothetical protein HYU66_24035, partial [Armatimonadetes bacterium]|nr:hypothetical protein [Armatimonadota bacterium]
LTAAADPNSLWRWTRLAFARGAAGVGWSAWPDLAANPARAQAVRHALDEVAAERLAEFRPEPGAAVLLEPFARGPLEDRDGLLGYAWVGGDGPAAWYDLLDRGTRYGPLAVLTPRDLERVRLDRFGCLFAASAFDLPAPAQEALRGYVEGGGLLVGDLGLGCASTAGCLAQLPPAMEEVFGLRVAAVRWTRDNLLDGRQRERLRDLARGAVPFPEMAAGLSQPGSFVFLRYSSLLPDIVPRQPTPPQIARSLLVTPSAYVVAGPNTRMLAEQNQIGDHRVSGISEHAYGRGVACFITSWLWQEWRAGDWLFDRFHGNLLAQRPRLTVREGDLLVPDGWDVGRGAGGQLWVHRLADTPGTLSIDLPCLEPLLYPGGLNAIRRAPPLDRAARVRATAEPLVNRRVEGLAGAQ